MIEHDDSVSRDDRDGIGDGIGEERKGEHMKHEIYGTRSRSRFLRHSIFRESEGCSLDFASEGARRRDRRLLEFRRSGKSGKKKKRKEKRDVRKEGIGGRGRREKNKIK